MAYLPDPATALTFRLERRTANTLRRALEEGADGPWTLARYLQLPRFGEGVLLDLDEPVCSCGAKADLARDKAELRNGAVFLLEEISCRAALSIELPGAPQSEELPDAAVAQLLRDALGATDELADDAVAPAD